MLEPYLLLQPATQRLLREGHKVDCVRVGNLTTALELAGAWLTVTMLDDEMRSLWDAPASAPAIKA